MALALVMGAPARAATTAATVTDVTQAEVTFLLEYVGQSGCDFHRNGTWHDAKRAREHLRYKYESLRAAGRIGTADEFIDGAATKSSLSGRPYLIRCPGGATVTSNEWLRVALVRYRLQGAPRAARDAPRALTFPPVPPLSRPSAP
jgi:hypothetical protein